MFGMKKLKGYDYGNKNGRKINALLREDEIIVEEAKRRGDIIHGSRAVKSQIGVFARQPSDWDILSKNPRKSANRVERRLDKIAGDDCYYLESSKYHKGTIKLKNVGKDYKKGTRDDRVVADYTKPSRRYETKKLLDGLKVVDINETLSDKRKALKRPEFKYRSEKDSEDVDRISYFKRYIQDKNNGLM